MIKEGSRAKEYQRAKNWLFLINILVVTVLLFFVLQSGLSANFRNAALSLSTWQPVTIAVYFLLLSFVFLCFDIALDFYGGYILEHHFGLSNQSITRWLWETAKRYLLAFAIAIVLVEALYLLVHFFSSWWWLLAWISWIAFSIVFGKLAPIIIVPLFYKYSPISDDSLRQQILEMVRRNDLRAENVYSLNLSKTTRKANAAFCGLGKTRRIILSDTLLNNFTHNEILSVVAHEIGHYRKKHLWKHIGLNALVSLISFYLVFLGVRYLAAIWGLDGAQDVAALPLMGLLAFLISMVAMPLGNMYSRYMEKEADYFAFHEMNGSEGFISTMEKLGIMNLADPDPHPLIEFLLYSHPPIKKRIAFARTYGARRA